MNNSAKHDPIKGQELLIRLKTIEDSFKPLIRRGQVPENLTKEIAYFIAVSRNQAKIDLADLATNYLDDLADLSRSPFGQVLGQVSAIRSRRP